ncbi:MAG: biotin/lipoyl-containing protein [Acidobacteriota bacterium]
MKLHVEVDGRRHDLELVKDRTGAVRVLMDGTPVGADVVELGQDAYSVILDGRSFDVSIALQAGSEPGLHMSRVVVSGVAHDVLLTHASRHGDVGGKARTGHQRITAPMPGKVVRVLVSAGQVVAKGQGLIVVEAMKMQNELKASRDGKVGQVKVAPGDSVEAGALLATIEPV